MWYHIIKGKGKRTKTKRDTSKGDLKRNSFLYQLSECILRFKTVGLLKCRYFSSEEDEVPWQVKNHSTYAVRIAS